MKSKKEYFVYLLLCKDNSLYTGITTDTKRRFEDHKSGKGAHYTRSHVPLKIVYTEGRHSRSSALKREAEIKKWKREKKESLYQTKKSHKSLA
jgi:putative endonuclease